MRGSGWFATRGEGEAGMTLVELIVVVSIIALLATAAVPVARWQVKSANCARTCG